MDPINAVSIAYNQMYEKLYLHLMEDVDDYAVILLDVNGNIQNWNKGAEKIKGYKPEEIIGKNFHIFYTPEDQHAFIPERLMAEAIRTGKASNEGWRVRKNKTLFFGKITITALYAENKLTGFLKVTRDLGEKFSKERYLNIIEQAPNALLLLDRDGKINQVNRKMESLFNYSREELLGNTIEVLFSENFGKENLFVLKTFAGFENTAKIGIEEDLHGCRKNGKTFPMEIHLSKIEVYEGSMVMAAITDISERKNSEERFRLVVESAPNAMILVSKEGKVQLVNSQSEKLFGYTRKEMIGEKLEMLIPERFRKEYFKIHELSAMGACRELYALRKTGSQFPVEIMLNPIEFNDGFMVLASFVDLSEKKTQESNRHKSEFLSNMSHELRTPMNAIMGFSEMLIDQKVGVLNPKQLEYLKDIHNSGSHLLHLINDVLDLSKIESGNLALHIEPFSIDSAIREVIQAVQSLADQKKLRIELTLSGQLIQAQLDQNKFRQILYNLLSNAIKFNTTGGTIYVSLDISIENYFILKVKDSGIGIAQNNLDKLFIPFVQLDSGSARKHEGTGLGLALTKKIVEALQGSISVESALGIGSIFTITLPIFFHQKSTESVIEQ